jgi:hypothetical protein
MYSGADCKRAAECGTPPRINVRVPAFRSKGQNVLSIQRNQRETWSSCLRAESQAVAVVFVGALTCPQGRRTRRYNSCMDLCRGFRHAQNAQAQCREEMDHTAQAACICHRRLGACRVVAADRPNK